MAETPTTTAAAVTPEPVPGAATRRRRTADPLTVVAVAALALFTVLGIGGPLFGHGVFAGTDELVTNAPYEGAGFATSPVRNDFLDDTWGSGIPSTLLFADAVGEGEFPSWNPYVSAGSPLGATPTNALLHPITVPFLLLPGWLAPAFVKLLEIVVAVLGCHLFLRRLGLGRTAAVTGGLVFVTSAFMVVWTNWPQTRVAAVVPFLFWAVERLSTRRRPADVALVALPVAAMLAGGFPAVTGYALLAAGIWFVVRVVAEHSGAPVRAMWTLAAGAAGVIGGAALAAGQLVPFALFMRSAYVEGRAQTPEDHLAPESLITGIAPWALGGVAPDGSPRWFLEQNFVESLSYVGAAALVLAIVAVASPRPARDILPRGAWGVLVALTGFGILVVWSGGIPLAVLQQLPVLFSDNFVGRARSVLGLLVAVLAAVGLEVLLRGYRARDEARARSWPTLFGLLVWIGAAAVGFLVWRRARWAADAADDRAADGVDRLAQLDTQVALGLAFVLAAVLCVAALRWVPTAAPRRALVSTTAVVLLSTLIVVQALTLVRPYWPRVDRDTFYPQTTTHEFLTASLGSERFAGTWGAMVMGADAAQRIRAVTGHSFVDANLGELVRTVPGTENLYPTYINFSAAVESATAPALDRLGTRYFVTAPEAPVFGSLREGSTDGSTTILRPSEPVRIDLPGAGPLRGVGVVPLGPVADDATVEISVRDAAGRVVADNDRGLEGAGDGTPFVVPVAGEAVAPDEDLVATVVLRSDEALPVQGSSGAPTVTTVAAADDGLRLVFADSGVVYERLTALPRIRWAPRSVVEPDEDRRLDMLGTGAVASDVVVLSTPSAPSSGTAAEFDVVEDGLDAIEVRVDADGAGHLVVADALQTGWVATVDGVSAPLVAADHAGVAVHVPPGQHMVRLMYQAPGGGIGTGISMAAVVVLAGLLGSRRHTERAKPSVAARPHDQVGQ
ncbi:hypothetical protein [Pseudonocardia sp.]|uniref:hypothetical protein n=1 Tax=Pseudonocardia sp. TaxID=60912 RepID=UPI002630428E|nr:hypothetical protein [Pseudonocardia sp.]